MPGLLLKLTTAAACCAGLLSVTYHVHAHTGPLSAAVSGPLSGAEQITLQAHVPQILQDAENAQRLSGQSYHGESPWGELILSFSPQRVSVFWQSWPAEGQHQDMGVTNGSWAVDQQGRLLLRFGPEQWLLFHIEQGLGEAMMFAYQSEQLGNSHFRFRQLPVTADPMGSLLQTAAAAYSAEAQRGAQPKSTPGSVSTSG